MKDSERDEVTNAVKATITKVNDRREAMFEALESLQEAMQIIFDTIENVPKGLAVYMHDDKVCVGMTDGQKATATAILHARVLWNVPDEGAEGVEYEVMMSNLNEPVTFTRLEDLAKYIAEPVIEDLINQADAAAALEAAGTAINPNAPPPDSTSAPPDQAAQRVFVYKVSVPTGQRHEGELSALSVHEAGQKLRDAGWTNIEALTLKE